MLVLDGFCRQGGAGAGYAAAGFKVTGIDIEPQTRYPHTFVLGDAVEFIYRHGSGYDLIHVSPPCQHDSDTQRIMDRSHPDLIGPTREALESTGRPWVIENVRGAVPKLRNPVMLCGTMFGLRTYRHRYFEAGGWTLTAPEHSQHTAPQAKMGRAPKPGEFISAVGNFSGVQMVRDDWKVPWMNREGIREAIPPAYTEWVGKQFTEWSKRNGR